MRKSHNFFMKLRSDSNFVILNGNFGQLLVGIFNCNHAIQNDEIWVGSNFREKVGTFPHKHTWSGCSWKFPLKVYQNCHTKWRNLSRIELSWKSWDFSSQTHLKRLQLKIPTKSWPKLPSKMTKFESDRTFVKKLGLFITNTPEAVAVENSH